MASDDPKWLPDFSSPDGVENGHPSETPAEGPEGTEKWPETSHRGARRVSQLERWSKLASVRNRS